MNIFPLPPSVIEKIEQKVDLLYDKAKARFLGNNLSPKALRFSVKHMLTLAGMYEASAQEERIKVDSFALESMSRIAQGYIEAHKERAKSKIIKEVGSILSEVNSGKIPDSINTALEGRLSQIWGDLRNGIEAIVDTETNGARNYGPIQAAHKIAKETGVTDPSMFFITVRDGNICKECVRLHLMPDGITPRVWKMSEIGHSYHKKGDSFPKASGLHPHCRCSISTVMPGYGFNKEGMITYIAPDHDELKKQRSEITDT